MAKKDLQYNDVKDKTINEEIETLPKGFFINRDGKDIFIRDFRIVPIDGDIQIAATNMSKKRKETWLNCVVMICFISEEVGRLQLSEIKEMPSIDLEYFAYVQNIDQIGEVSIDTKCPNCRERKTHDINVEEKIKFTKEKYDKIPTRDDLKIKINLKKGKLKAADGTLHSELILSQPAQKHYTSMRSDSEENQWDYLYEAAYKLLEYPESSYEDFTKLKAGEIVRIYRKIKNNNDLNNIVEVKCLACGHRYDITVELKDFLMT